MSKFSNALHGLLYYWGGDTPSEAIWSANEFLDIYKEIYGFECNDGFMEMDEGHNVKILIMIEEHESKNKRNSTES